mmetsp:Transcript_33807/g.78069  ORF Transcript_33807/g.78069 Transcript_33807/m.78069 type:complete len:166 (+) Transcript_33807:206-703(+)
MTETEVNTERVITKTASIRHVEGGWPKDVDFTEQSDVTRYRKKAEKDAAYKTAIVKLVPIVGRCMLQNNSVNIYEDFFSDDDIKNGRRRTIHGSDPPSAKGLAVLKDPNHIKRTITSIDWHPELNTTKLAASYSIMNFQDKRVLEDHFYMPVSSTLMDTHLNDIN